MSIQNDVRSRVALRSLSRPTSMIQRNVFFIIKRLFDLFFSLTLFLLLFPLFLFICFTIYKKESKPIFFRHIKMGKNQRPFTLFSFRTMTNQSKVIRSFPPHPFPSSWEHGVPNEFVYKKDESKDESTIITATGLWLMKYKLDKMPLLINVIKGDMSFIGPEPENVDIADYYNRRQAKRLTIKPGITGYAQLNKDFNMTYDQKVNHDLYYIENCSYRLDSKIITSAIMKIIKNNSITD